MIADEATQPSAATNRFVRQSIADTTRRTYETGQRSFMSYCASLGVKAGRASGVNAANWLAHLAEVEWKTSSTILNYKAAMRTWFLELQMNRANNPFDSVWVEKTLQGIQRDEAVKVREQEAKVADAPALTLDLLACFKPQLLSKLSSIAQRMSCTVGSNGVASTQRIPWCLSSGTAGAAAKSSQVLLSNQSSVDGGRW